MFKDAEKQLETILRVVEKCPEPLREKCFEILLTAYAATAARAPEPRTPVGPVHTPPPPATSRPEKSPVPPSLQSRFGAMAKRMEIAQPQLERLFDFTAEPFTFHAYSVPGDNIGQKTRNIALLVAAKTYLANSVYAADAKEVKAECVNQSCYDQPNFWTYFKRGGGEGLFKPTNAGKAIELTAAGVKAAQNVLKALAELP